jgi:hypothetical protein
MQHEPSSAVVQTANSITDRSDGRVEVRTVPLTREQMAAIGAVASIAARLGRSYELYGGVNVKDALAHLNTLDGAWYDARDSARLELGHEPSPDEEE